MHTSPNLDRQIEEAIAVDLDVSEHPERSSYKGDKCMACEAGEIDENDYCDNCGCMASAD
jgi:hypothetical protein